MKHVIIAIIICASAAACSFRSERVVERPAPPPATATVVVPAY